MAISTSPYATNNFGVNSTPIDYSQAYTPSLMTYHGGSICVNNNIVGRITEFQSAGAYTREGNHVYEVNNNTWGLPVDYVPGRATGFNITMTRNEVWSQELEIALGYPAVFNNLTDQNYPFVANEYLFKGTNVYRAWTYYSCWFMEKNPSAWSASGDGICSVTCNMAYVSRKRTA